LVKRRTRDIYGNWIWEDDEEIKTSVAKNSIRENVEPSSSRFQRNKGKGSEDLKLDWRDFVALSIASLETFLLPIVIFILVLFGIVIGLSILH